MRTRRRATIEDLRAAIQALPRPTRIAMLEGIRANQIIVGAYTSRDGICPMLAAHRAGGRTSLISFARAWDRFALGGARVAQPRPATARELLVLRTHLEASLLEEDAPMGDLGGAIADHRALIGRLGQAQPVQAAAASAQRPPRLPTGERERTSELAGRPGWRWMRLVRRYDDYQRALDELRRLEAGPGHVPPVPADAGHTAH